MKTELTPIICKRISGMDVYEDRSEPGMPHVYLGFLPGVGESLCYTAALMLTPDTNKGEMISLGVKQGYKYATTIGVYLIFKPVMRQVRLVSGEIYDSNGEVVG